MAVARTAGVHRALTVIAALAAGGCKPTGTPTAQVKDEAQEAAARDAEIGARTMTRYADNLKSTPETCAALAQTDYPNHPWIKQQALQPNAQWAQQLAGGLNSLVLESPKPWGDKFLELGEAGVLALPPYLFYPAIFNSAEVDGGRYMTALARVMRECIEAKLTEVGATPDRDAAKVVAVVSFEKLNKASSDAVNTVTDQAAPFRQGLAVLNDRARGNIGRVAQVEPWRNAFDALVGKAVDLSSAVRERAVKLSGKTVKTFPALEAPSKEFDGWLSTRQVSLALLTETDTMVFNGSSGSPAFTATSIDRDGGPREVLRTDGTLDFMGEMRTGAIGRMDKEKRGVDLVRLLAN